MEEQVVCGQVVCGGGGGEEAAGGGPEVAGVQNQKRTPHKDVGNYTTLITLYYTTLQFLHLIALHYTNCTTLH